VIIRLSETEHFFCIVVFLLKLKGDVRINIYFSSLLSYKYKLRAKNKDGTKVTKTEPVCSINDEHRGRDPRHDRDRDRAEPCRICEALKNLNFLDAVKSCPWRI
jgi:hypothetical protein